MDIPSDTTLIIVLLVEAYITIIMLHTSIVSYACDFPIENTPWTSLQLLSAK
jgi:hypothetical protein